MGLLLALLFLWPQAADSPVAQPPTRWPIESVSVSGNRRYQAGPIVAAAGLQLGQIAGKEELEAARQRLMDTGAFASIAYSYAPSASNQGLRVTYEVVEAAEIYPLRVERLGATVDEMAEWLKRSDPLYTGDVPATQQALARYAKAIQSYLASRNIQEDVSGRVVVDNQGQMVALFGPATLPPSVAEVRFTGNDAVPAAKLQNTMAGVAVGILYDETRFRQVLEANIRPVYEEIGRIRVAFPKVTVEPAKDVAGVAVTVEIQEGGVYKLVKVQLAGDGLPEKDLLRAADFKTDDTANFTAVGAGVDRMKKRLTRSGYLKPEIGVERNIRDTDKEVDLTIHVEPGPQYVFGKLAVQGLDIIGEAAIRRIWGMKPGAPFDAGYPDYFLTRVREDGLFDNLGKTKSAIKLDEQAHTVDVTLVF